MRQIGSLADQQAAMRFSAYLVTQGTDAVVERNSDKWVVWVRDENQVDRARKSFQDYQSNPSDSKYDGVEGQALELKRQERRRRDEARKNVVPMGQKWKGGVARKAPLTFVLIGLCVLASVWTEFGKSVNNFRILAFSDSPTASAEAPTGSSPDLEVFAAIERGEVWRLITPIFMHGNWLHLAFNVYWLSILGGQVEDRKGALLLLRLVLISAILSNSAQAVFFGPLFLGFSGVGYALFGYVWMKSVYEPSGGIRIDRVNVILFIVWFFVGLGGFAGPTANLAHGAGLVVGVMWGYMPQLLSKRDKLG